MRTRIMKFPNGDVVKMRLSTWHWRLFEIYSVDDTPEERRSGGVIWHWYKDYDFDRDNLRRGLSHDEDISAQIMRCFREEYNTMRAGTPEGHPIQLDIFPTSTESSD